MKRFAPLLLGIIVVLLVGSVGAPTRSRAQGDGSAPTSGNYISALKFDVKDDGFKFENYGGESQVKNADAATLQRLFGDVVCANKAKGGCTLTPQAEEYLAFVNKAINGGHCEGMAIMSLLFQQKKLDPMGYDGAKAFSIALQGNEKLQKEVAFWWSSQVTAELITFKNQTKVTPNDVLKVLDESFKGGKEVYTLAFFKRDRSGGHAVTPWAIEDRGNGIYWILIYDNNWPGINRAIEVDSNANTWKYEAAINPGVEAALYEGDAETSTLTPIPLSLRLTEKFQCFFCEQKPAARTLGLARLADVKTYNQLWMIGDGDLLITDDQGRNLGFKDGKFVTEIPGALVQVISSGRETWAEDEEPIYMLPTGVKFTITIDGSGLKQESITDIAMIGPGYDLSITGIKLEPNQKDTLVLEPDGKSIAYTTTSNESPTLGLGFDDEAADYAFDLVGVDLDGGGTLSLTLDKAAGKIALTTRGNSKPGAYAFIMDRIGEEDAHTFEHDDIALEPGDTAYINYGAWSGAKGTIKLELDKGSTGKITATAELEAN